MASIFQSQLSEQIVRIEDRESGLDGFIVIHSTRLGPAVGGCRLRTYASSTAASVDALRLAEGMSYKNALAGLPFGGGKAVIRKPDEPFDRNSLFRAFGRAVASLDGRYITAEDVGTSVEDMATVAETTAHVAGLARKPGAAGGDPSPWTALGVFQAMGVAIGRRLKASYSDVTVAVQGLGHVGFALCELLHEAGARLIVADPHHALTAEAAQRFGAKVTEPSAIFEAPADIFAPCALGAILDRRSIPRLRATIVCGAANNQLATPEDGDALARRDILYAPDYLVNAGGIINVAAEYFGWPEEDVRCRIHQIGPRLNSVLDFAAREAIAPQKAADAIAKDRLSTGPDITTPMGSGRPLFQPKPGCASTAPAGHGAPIRSA